MQRVKRREAMVLADITNSRRRSGSLKQGLSWIGQERNTYGILSAKAIYGFEWLAVAAHLKAFARHCRDLTGFQLASSLLGGAGREVAHQSLATGDARPRMTLSNQAFRSANTYHHTHVFAHLLAYTILIYSYIYIMH